MHLKWSSLCSNAMLPVPHNVIRVQDQDLHSLNPGVTAD